MFKIADLVIQGAVAAHVRIAAPKEGIFMFGLSLEKQGALWLVVTLH
jgi:hypothetical protein